jgi:hypothetical protein
MGWDAGFKLAAGGRAGGLLLLLFQTSSSPFPFLRRSAPRSNSFDGPGSKVLEGFNLHLEILTTHTSRPEMTSMQYCLTTLQRPSRFKSCPPRQQPYFILPCCFYFALVGLRACSFVPHQIESPLTRSARSPSLKSYYENSHPSPYPPIQDLSAHATA